MRSPIVLACALCACASQPPPAQSATASSSGQVAQPCSSALGAPPQANAGASTAPGASPTTGTTHAEADALRAAEAWLAEVDAGKYADSWTASAASFRAAIDQPGWLNALTKVRTPLGTLKSRALHAAHYAHRLPGVPEGEYVVVQFDTAFDNKQPATETVTPMKEADGQWRVAGYFIK